MAYKPAEIPANFDCVDATVEQVMAYRHESARKVFAKLRSGAYVSYRNGKRRLIVFASVKLDRDRGLSQGPQFAADLAPGKKRQRGRPRTTQAAQ